MELPEGVRRTTVGAYTLIDDIGFSREIGDTWRLDTDAHEEITAFARYIPAGGVVVNAGASIGDHVEVYSRLVGGGGRVYAFEPHPRACAALRLNTARLNNVTVREYALGYVAGPAVLAVSPVQGCSTILPAGMKGRSNYHDGRPPDPLVDTPIAMVTLDGSLLPKLTRCDLIHLDTEGTEAQALIGAQALIRRFRPVIVLEVGQTHLTRWGLTPADVQGLLHQLGYTTTDLNEISRVDESSGRVWNVLALPLPDAATQATIIPQLTVGDELIAI